METELIAEDSPDRYTEDPTDDELLAAEMGGTPAELKKSWGDRAADVLEKAGPFKYKSRKKIKGKWVYDYGE